MRKARRLSIEGELGEKPAKIVEKWGNHVHYLEVRKDKFVI